MRNKKTLKVNKLLMNFVNRLCKFKRRPFQEALILQLGSPRKLDITTWKCSNESEKLLLLYFSLDLIVLHNIAVAMISIIRYSWWSAFWNRGDSFKCSTKMNGYFFMRLKKCRSVDSVWNWPQQKWLKKSEDSRFVKLFAFLKTRGGGNLFRRY